MEQKLPVLGFKLGNVSRDCVPRISVSGGVCVPGAIVHFHKRLAELFKLHRNLDLCIGELDQYNVVYC